MKKKKPLDINDGPWVQLLTRTALQKFYSDIINISDQVQLQRKTFEFLIGWFYGQSAVGDWELKLSLCKKSSEVGIKPTEPNNYGRDLESITGKYNYDENGNVDNVKIPFERLIKYIHRRCRYTHVAPVVDNRWLSSLRNPLINIKSNSEEWKKKCGPNRPKTYLGYDKFRKSNERCDMNEWWKTNKATFTSTNKNEHSKDDYYEVTWQHKMQSTIANMSFDMISSSKNGSVMMNYYRGLCAEKTTPFDLYGKISATNIAFATVELKSCKQLEKDTESAKNAWIQPIGVGGWGSRFSPSGTDRGYLQTAVSCVAWEGGRIVTETFNTLLNNAVLPVVNMIGDGLSWRRNGVTSLFTYAMTPTDNDPKKKKD